MSMYDVYCNHTFDPSTRPSPCRTICVYRQPHSYDSHSPHLSRHPLPLWHLARLYFICISTRFLSDHRMSTQDAYDLAGSMMGTFANGYGIVPLDSLLLPYDHPSVVRSINEGVANRKLRVTPDTTDPAGQHTSCAGDGARASVPYVADSTHTGCDADVDDLANDLSAYYPRTVSMPYILHHLCLLRHRPVQRLHPMCRLGAYRFASIHPPFHSPPLGPRTPATRFVIPLIYSRRATCTHSQYHCTSAHCTRDFVSCCHATIAIHFR